MIWLCRRHIEKTEQKTELVTGHDPTRGSGQKVFNPPRVGSGRVGSSQKVLNLSRVGVGVGVGLGDPTSPDPTSPDPTRPDPRGFDPRSVKSPEKAGARRERGRSRRCAYFVEHL